MQLQLMNINKHILILVFAKNLDSDTIARDKNKSESFVMFLYF